MKKTYTYILTILAIVCGAFVTAGCDDDFSYSKDYSVYNGVILKVKMADENNVLNLNLINNTYQVRVDVTPGDVRINSQEYLYEIEDESIASIDGNGLLTMKKEGETRLTVKLAVRPEIATSCTVKVKPILANRLVVPEELYVKEGFTRDLSELISITPSIANCPLTYRVEDATLATVSEEGIVTGLKAGNTTLTVSTADGSNLSGVIQLEVGAKKYITEIQLPVAAVGGERLNVGDEVNVGGLTTILPADAEEPNVVFSVKSGADVVSITETGVMKCLKAGTAVILATAQDGSGITSEMEVTVFNADATTIWADRIGWTVPETSMGKSGTTNYVPDGATNGKPELILDGNNGTYLSIRKPEYPGASNKEIYFMVDRGTTDRFNMIKYEHRHLNNLLSANKIEISGSDDGQTFTLIKGDIETPFEIDGQKVYIHEAFVPVSTYRYIKVKVTDWILTNGSSGTAVQTAEFNVGLLENK